MTVEAPDGAEEETMTIHQFSRRDLNDNATETLSLVRLGSSGSLAVQVETGTPETWRKDPNDRTFVGLYDTDGEAFSYHGEWELADDVSNEDADKIFAGWEVGNSVVERLSA